MQCVDNVFSNAEKLVSPGVLPRVTVRSEVVGQDVRLWFEDNGIGISLPNQERIFALFGRINPVANPWASRNTSPRPQSEPAGPGPFDRLGPATDPGPGPKGNRGRELTRADGRWKLDEWGHPPPNEFTATGPAPAHARPGSRR